MKEINVCVKYDNRGATVVKTCEGSIVDILDIPSSDPWYWSKLARFAEGGPIYMAPMPQAITFAVKDEVMLYLYEWSYAGSYYYLLTTSEYFPLPSSTYRGEINPDDVSAMAETNFVATEMVEVYRMATDYYFEG